MSIPAGVGIVDTMINFPHTDRKAAYGSITARTKDAESQAMAFPAQHVFGDSKEEELAGDDPIAATLAEMDRWGVAVGMIGVLADGLGEEAQRRHPDRFVASVSVDPTDVVGAVRRVREAREAHDARAVSFFPAGCAEPVAIDDRRAYPVYATCVELGLPIFVCAGIPGPRLPYDSQHPGLADRVMYDFPELTFVYRHGCQPWVEVAIHLMRKWPNLHYSTSAYAPSRYPQQVLDYATSRTGQTKVLYGGYFPMGLTLERLVTELGELPLPEEIMTQFLRGNAARLLKLDP